MVEPEQIFAAGRNAGHCPNDQLRNPAHSFGGAGNHDCWFPLPDADRGMQARILMDRALECIHAVGIRGIYLIYDRRRGGIQSLSF